MGRVSGGFRKDFNRILEGFWAEFWEEFVRMFVKFVWDKTLIRATKRRSMNE